MNKTNKYVWTLYLLIWFYFIFFDTSYNKESNIATYLFLGWIPFLLASWIWKRNNEVVKSPQPAEEVNSQDIQYQHLYQIQDKNGIFKIFTNRQRRKNIIRSK
jgi:hypothetical protein